MAWTVQKLIDERMTLHAYCHNHRCHHNQRLDLEKLKARLGPDAPAMADDLIPKLKCSKVRRQATRHHLFAGHNADREIWLLSAGEGRAMSDKPGTLYIVSVYEKPHWRSTLTTRDKAEAESLKEAMIADQVKARIEIIEPKKKK